MGIEDKIQELTKQLYPTGIAFKVAPNSWREAFLRALRKSEVRAYQDALSIAHGLLPDNDQFTVADAEAWEETLKIPYTTGLSLSQRKAAIARRIAHPAGVLNRQSANYLKAQIESAGFGICTVTNNEDEITPNVQLGVSLEVYQLADAQIGEGQSGATYPDKIINSLVPVYDKNYYWGENNLIPSFFISGIDALTPLDIPTAREEEFRSLVLRVKPCQTVAYLNINLV